MFSLLTHTQRKKAKEREEQHLSKAVKSCVGEYWRYVNRICEYTHMHTGTGGLVRLKELSKSALEDINKEDSRSEPTDKTIAGKH